MTGKRFRFVGASVEDGRKRLHWERPLSGDSRAEHLRCDAEWFWTRPKEGTT